MTPLNPSPPPPPRKADGSQGDEPGSQGTLGHKGLMGHKETNLGVDQGICLEQGEGFVVLALQVASKLLRQRGRRIISGESKQSGRRKRMRWEVEDEVGSGG